jgi:ferric-dicitrate binding protein FerR (iron transport regulator)
MIKKKRMEKNTPWHIISKYFRKQATQEEITELSHWLEKDKENEKLMAEAFNIYTVTNSLPQPLNPDMKRAWQRIDRRITQSHKLPTKLLGKIKYAAAIAILLIALSVIWHLNSPGDNQLSQQYTEIVTPMGQKTMVVLPDSSLVWLNSGSSLKYKGNFNVKEREVVLEGEAYFEVQKNKLKRFRVKTGILNVDVYGTAFNVKNHSDDNFQEITVTEGRVGISDKTGEIRQLICGEQALLDKKSNKIVFTKNAPEIVSAWKNNELVFDNTPLEEAIKYLERWYGVNISIDSTMIGKHNYTFKVKTESFREMLEMMKIITPLEYEINGKDVKIYYVN